MIYGDELAPSGGNAGGGIYKFVPAIPFQGTGQITVPAQSPLASGTDLRAARRRVRARRTGDRAPKPARARGSRSTCRRGVVDANGNIILRNAQALQKFTGYYRPEDMDIDPIARENGVFRACWANTGRMSHTDSSIVENSGVKSEIMCLIENPPSPFDPNPATGTIPTVDRFVTGSEQRGDVRQRRLPAAHRQPGGARRRLGDSVKSADRSTELRGNDLWICLPDGDDDDLLSDGCVRFASIRDTTAEPSGSSSSDRAGGTGQHPAPGLQRRPRRGNHGALVKISGFKVSPPDEFDDQQ